MTSILIVDADPSIRTVAAEILEGAGVMCAMGDNPSEAPHLARINLPDGVLLGIGRSLEGIEAARIIKAEWPKTVVVLLTAHGEDAYLGWTGKTGADALLPKRALQQTLLATLRRLDGPAFGKLWDGGERRRGLQGSPPRPERRRPLSPPGTRIAGEPLEKHSSQVRQPGSGLSRIPFAQPCHLEGVEGHRDAKTCNLSPAGIYITLEPVPDVGEGFVISLSLPGREVPLTVDSVVTWRNALWDRRVLGLPPGCGLQFLGLSSQDLQHIHALVKSHVTRSPRLPWAYGH
jgi:CheY-like chemotaxis protein